MGIHCPSLAGCDARTRFMMWCCNAKGSANDIMAWRYSHMYNEVYLREKIPEEYFFIHVTVTPSHDIIGRTFGVAAPHHETSSRITAS